MKCGIENDFIREVFGIHENEIKMAIEELV